MVDVVALAKEILSIPSLSGGEGDVASLIARKMRDGGVDDVVVDSYGSVIGIVNGNRKGKTVLMDGHIDTVPVNSEDEWAHKPYGCEIADGKLYARGSSDMKGSVACMLSALLRFAKSRDFSGRIALSCTVHEECFEGVSSRLVSAYVKPDFVIIGEATTGTVKIGQRGRAEVVVETYGKSCHSSNPEKGVNAITGMVKLLGRMSEIKPKRDPLLGEGIMVCTDVISSPYPGASVIPDKARATFDRRLLVGETKESVLEPINELIASLEKEDSYFKAKAYISSGSEKCYTGSTISAERFFPAWAIDKDHELVVAAVNALRREGLKHELSHYAFCTNGSHFAGEAGIPTIGYGPSLESLAHVKDEYVEVSELENAERGFVAILSELTGCKGA